ncbi:outer membrane beta-barrel protein [Aliiglaciecola sp. NS0011-25]|uniref:outer membrane beta-barrel protein n=1 Tax=Aliiglaciecola sp. NS0011-25 TaxID=3127654 RepID=UPI003102ABB5
MNNRYLAGLLLVLIASPAAFANSSLKDIRFVAGASLGYSTFSFSEKLDHDISFPSVNIPVAVTLENWQLSANLQTTLKDADISEEEDTGKASRDDLDITLGYRLSKNWTLFGGYKYGNTKIQFTPRDIDEEDQLNITDERYRQKGPFVGISYHWQFEKAGSLSLSVAFADLRANNVFSENTDEEEEEEAIEFDDLTGNVSGDTKGFSYSLSWTMPVSSNLLFQTRFKINDYQQDIDYNGAQFNGIDESFTSLHVGLAYVF